MINANFDLSVGGLFPNDPEAAQDGKCVVIAKLIKELIQSGNLCYETQKDVQMDAKKRYTYLSEKKRISVTTADYVAFRLCKQGIACETLIEYYSFRLTEQDIQKWKNVIIKI